MKQGSSMSLWYAIPWYSSSCQRRSVLGLRPWKLASYQITGQERPDDAAGTKGSRAPTQWSLP